MESPKEMNMGWLPPWAWDPDFLLTYQDPTLPTYLTYVTPHVHSLRHHQLLFGLAALLAREMGRILPLFGHNLFQNFKKYSLLRKVYTVQIVVTLIWLCRPFLLFPYTVQPFIFKLEKTLNRLRVSFLHPGLFSEAAWWHCRQSFEYGVKGSVTCCRCVIRQAM